MEHNTAEESFWPIFIMVRVRLLPRLVPQKRVFCSGLQPLDWLKPWSLALLPIPISSRYTWASSCEGRDSQFVHCTNLEVEAGSNLPHSAGLIPWPLSDRIWSISVYWQKCSLLSDLWEKACSVIQTSQRPFLSIFVDSSSWKFVIELWLWKACLSVSFFGLEPWPSQWSVLWISVNCRMCRFVPYLTLRQACSGLCPLHDRILLLPVLCTMFSLVINCASKRRALALDLAEAQTFSIGTLHPQIYFTLHNVQTCPCFARKERMPGP